MAQEHFDVLFLGGGTGGYVAAIRATQLGLKAAIVEKDKVGGTCLHRGCIPTKALLESAHIFSLHKRGSDFGIHASNISYDFSEVNKRKDRIVSQLFRGVEFLLSKNKVTMVKGQGRIIDRHTVGVYQGNGGEFRLTTDQLVIATGSRPKSLPGVAFDGRAIINSDHAVNLEHVPNSIIIVGAGAIGAEFASILNSFGCEVTLVEALPTLVPHEDPEIGKELAASFTKQGIKIYAGTKTLLNTVRTDGKSVELEIVKNGDTRRLQAEKLLIAVGREGNIENIGLDNLNLKTERGFIKVDEYMRTEEPDVFAIGDVAGGYLLAHVASAEGIMVVENIAGLNPRPIDYNRIPRITYSFPQVASIGLSESEANSKGYSTRIGRFPLRANSMALIHGEPEGLVKVVSHADTSEILGVHILAERAADMISEPALARFLEATTEEIGENIHAHPTVSEALGEAALDVDGKAIHIWRG